MDCIEVEGVERDSKEGVFLVEGSQVRFTPVECSDGPNGGLVVDSGLQGGEVIVLYPSEDLSDGDAVRTQ